MREHRYPHNTDFVQREPKYYLNAGLFKRVRYGPFDTEKEAELFTKYLYLKQGYSLLFMDLRVSFELKT